LTSPVSAALYLAVSIRSAILEQTLRSDLNCDATPCRNAPPSSICHEPQSNDQNSHIGRLAAALKQPRAHPDCASINLLAPLLPSPIMFFFFTCGEHTFRKEVPGYEGMVCQCHHCGNMAGHVIKSNPWFTFCFIPVIPLSLKGYKDVSCRICNFHQPLENRPDVVAMGQGGAAPPHPGQQPYPQQGPPQGWGQPQPNKPPHYG
jgi:hypothetical protein